MRAAADLEEAFSVAQTWPPGRRHFPNIGRFFSRPINTDVLRPVDANAAVVSPADSVLQNAFFVKPDAHGKVVGARVPQVGGERRHRHPSPLLLPAQLAAPVSLAATRQVSQSPTACSPDEE